ncbi:MAG: hypothetical protein QXS66_08640 [Thermoproteota archaeon]
MSIFFFMLSVFTNLFLLLWIDLWTNLFIPLVFVILVIIFSISAVYIPPKMPNKQNKSWVSWLQLEWLYQNYFKVNYIVSLYLFIIVSFKFLEQGYSLWEPVIQAIISTLVPPLFLSIISKILKRDEYGEFQVYRSKVGRMCFAYSAETMINHNRMREAIRYMRYALEMLDKQYQEKGFMANSVHKAVFLLEILESEEALYSDELRKLASILVNCHTINEYITHLASFLKDFKWFEDIEKIPRKQNLYLIWKLLTSGIVVTFFSWLIQTYSDIIRAWISKLIPVFLGWILPALVSLPLFFYLEKFVPKYQIDLSDLEVLVKYFDAK